MTTAASPALTFIVPIYNESVGLPELFTRLTDIGNRITRSHEILLVNDDVYGRFGNETSQFLKIPPELDRCSSTNRALSLNPKVRRVQNELLSIFASSRSRLNTA